MVVEEKLTNKERWWAWHKKILKYGYCFKSLPLKLFVQVGNITLTGLSCNALDGKQMSILKVIALKYLTTLSATTQDILFTPIQNTQIF